MKEKMPLKVKFLTSSFQTQTATPFQYIKSIEELFGVLNWKNRPFRIEGGLRV